MVAQGCLGTKQTVKLSTLILPDSDREDEWVLMFCFLQIFCEINFNSKVIVKGITDPYDNFKKNFHAWVNQCLSSQYCLLILIYDTNKNSFQIKRKEIYI